MFFLSATQTSSPLEEPQQTFPLAMPFAVPVLERLFLPGGQLEWFCWYFGSSSTRRHLLQHRGLGAPGKRPVSVCLQVPRGHAAFHWPPAQLLQPGYKSGCRMDMGLKPEISTLLCPWSSQERFGGQPQSSAEVFHPSTPAPELGHSPCCVHISPDVSLQFDIYTFDSYIFATEGKR